MNNLEAPFSYHAQEQQILTLFGKKSRLKQTLREMFTDN
jgi:hypothetical protein